MELAEQMLCFGLTLGLVREMIGNKIDLFFEGLTLILVGEITETKPKLE